MKKKILYLGSSGFPFLPAASIQRQFCISRLLIEAGYNVTVVCTKGTIRDNLSKFKGDYKSINYVYTSLTSKYFNLLILRILSRIFGRINEFIYITFGSILTKKKI